MNSPGARTDVALSGAASAATLCALFFASGTCALVYEVAWFHLLRLSIGSSAISVALLLGSFMGGMCLGSWALPRIVRRSWPPLLVYAALEFGIGAFGAWMPDLLPALGRFYANLHAEGASSAAWRGAIAAAALIPPTMLMGATLPAVARQWQGRKDANSWLARFYGSNVVGAVAGTLAAGFFLMRVYDVRTASHVAAVGNGIIGVTALLLLRTCRVAPVDATQADAITQPRVAARSADPALLAIALSGLTALGCEILWTRQLSLLLGATTYTFSLILAVFLTGLGIGTSLGARWSRTCTRPRAAFGRCQLALVPAILWSSFAIAHVVPFGEPTWIFQEHVYTNMPLHYVWDFARCLLALLPACVLWGASFPLAIATSSREGAPSDRVVGGLYAANTIGAILGAIGTGLFAVATIGTQDSNRALVLAAAVAALLLLGERQDSADTTRTSLRRVAAATGVTSLAAVCAVLVPGLSPGLVAFGRSVDKWAADVDYLCVKEGVSASVAVSEYQGHRSFHVSGKVVASTQGLDMRLQRMLGHLPCLAHGAPRSVLVVGCGAGVTAGCFVEWPTVERIVVCEIEPAVVAAARTHLADVNRGVLDDPRTQIVLDDARHYLATTTETFDVITSDPIHPWVRGAAALYTSEYYDLVKARLRDGGVVTQWVPLYQTDAAAVKSQLATLFDAFPFSSIWNSDPSNRGYDLVAMARRTPMSFDLTRMQTAIEDNPMLRASLGEAELGSALSLLSTFAGDASTMTSWLADAERNVDVSLRLQYLAGLSLDRYQDAEIFAAIRGAFRVPDGMFTGADHELDALYAALLR